MEETWKNIENHPDYFILNCGRVKSLKGKTERILKLGKMTSGYLFAGLSENGIVKNVAVHRLVAQAFLPNPSGYLDVNHLDGNKINNCVENLEWCNRS